MAAAIAMVVVVVVGAAVVAIAAARITNSRSSSGSSSSSTSSSGSSNSSSSSCSSTSSTIGSHTSSNRGSISNNNKNHKNNCSSTVAKEIITCNFHTLFSWWFHECSRVCIGAVSLTFSRANYRTHKSGNAQHVTLLEQQQTEFIPSVGSGVYPICHGLAFNGLQLQATTWSHRHGGKA